MTQARLAGVEKGFIMKLFFRRRIDFRSRDERGRWYGRVWIHVIRWTVMSLPILYDICRPLKLYYGYI